MRSSLLFKEKSDIKYYQKCIYFGFTHCPPAERGVVIFVLELILCVTIQQIFNWVRNRVSLGKVIFPSCKSRTVLWT